jgi:hypothetical protein
MRVCWGTRGQWQQCHQWHQCHNIQPDEVQWHRQVHSSSSSAGLRAQGHIGTHEISVGVVRKLQEVDTAMAPGLIGRRPSWPSKDLHGCNNQQGIRGRGLREGEHVYHRACVEAGYGQHTELRRYTV